MRVNDLVRFIKERESIRVKKEAGKPRPWTRDPILDRYRFCNVHRENDAVTCWLRVQWYILFGSDPDVWFAAIVARLLNQPDALDAVREYILPWDPKKFAKALHARRDKGLRNFNAAYIVSTNGRAMDKVRYITECVLTPIWKLRANMRASLKGASLEQMHELLSQFNGLGSFMAAQVVADLKYIKPWNAAPDWNTFASSGPGSRRGLNRVMEREVNAPWREAAWRERLAELREQVIKRVPMHAQDLQNCLCEFDKYERARLGEGEPKQIYKEKE